MENKISKNVRIMNTGMNELLAHFFKGKANENLQKRRTR